MQPPAIPMPDELRAADLIASGQLASTDTHFDPGPASPGPDFEHDTVVGTLPPYSGIEGDGLVPGAWGYGWAIRELFATGFRFLFTHAPASEIAIERFSG